MKKRVLVWCIFASLLQSAPAWDYAGHRIVNELALASLPKNFPIAFTAQARERILFLGGEPDRWRNTPDLELRHCSGPDHYINLEELPLYGLSPATLPNLRYDFVAQMARTRAAHPERFFPIDPAKDADHTRELTGFLPWAITENYERLKSEFSYLKAYEESGGTPEEIANARANILYTMGILGHFAGDAAQPLHTTVHFNGWFGPNPRHYTTRRTFHAWIDGGYISLVDVRADLGAMRQRIRPAHQVRLNGQVAGPEDFFRAVMSFIQEQNRLVEPLYDMEKEGGFSGQGARGLRGKALIEGQLVKAGQWLGELWYSAWRQAPEDGYLKRQLEKAHGKAVSK